MSSMTLFQRKMTLSEKYYLVPRFVAEESCCVRAMGLDIRQARLSTAPNEIFVAFSQDVWSMSKTRKPSQPTALTHRHT